MSEASTERPAASVDASASRIAHVYAEALFEEAKKIGAVEEVLDEMHSLQADVANSDPLLSSFFLGGVVGREKRGHTLRLALAGKITPLFLNFLVVLNEHDRLALLAPVQASYRQIVEERTGKVRVQVRSAVTLDPAHRDRLMRELRETTGREPILDTHVDPELLGGLVVQVGDFLYDGSVRTRLETLRAQLIERSSHEIQTGRDRFSSAN